MRTLLIINLFFLLLGGVSAQGICNPKNVDEIVRQRKIRMALDKMAKELIQKTCPITGRFPNSSILNCYEMEEAYEKSDGSIYNNCIFLEVNLNWSGWTCIFAESDSYYEMEAVAVFKDDQLIDMPQKLISFNDAFGRAERCNLLIQKGLEGDMEGMLTEILNNIGGL